MLNTRKYAAIDIGSNAIRLLICDVFMPEGKPIRFKKTSLVRVPIRLGADVFVHGKISRENMQRMQDSMLAFSLLIKSHKVDTYKAVATSAMRDATNGGQVVQLVQQNTGIQIDIIDGSHEAAIIAMTDLHSMIDSRKNYLYVDVGGGSTEFTLYMHGETVASKSFKIGTVRLLNNLVNDATWNAVEQWVKEQCQDLDKVYLIGSGGNINNIFKNSGKRDGKTLSYFYLASYYELLNSYTYEERIVELGLNPDRADVIIPAAKIYLSAMKWSGAKDVYVPKIGLSDGIIKSIYNNEFESVIK